MKKIILLFSIIFLLILIPLICYPEEITLEWDKVEGVDGYYLYQTTVEKKFDTNYIFDYTTPILTDKYPDGKIPQDITSVTINLPGEENKDTKYAFTAKSFLGSERSADSNYVDYIVSLVAPVSPNELDGVFNKEEGIITISWEQPVEEYSSWRKISHWIIYYRLENDLEWIPIGRITSDHELNMTAPFTAVDDGESKEVQFVVVAYRRSGVYSQNSDILTININREGVPPIQNLRIRVDIPII